MKKIAFILPLILCCIATTLHAQHKPIAIWPGIIPGALSHTAKDTPTVVPYLADATINTGTAVVICPGGAYGFLAFDHEGTQVARWFNSFGVSAFVLDYRHAGKGYHQPYPLLDLQQAIRLVRAKAGGWGIDKNKIGVMGFSAGGHLASSAGTHFDNGIKHSTDSMLQQSCRPDFMLLIYPVITMGKFTHGGSRDNLLGKGAKDSLINFYSSELKVTDETPPSFLVHTIDDATVPYQNSVLFFDALQRHKISSELHLYQTGEHGFGLAVMDEVLHTYTTLLKNWMMKNGFLINHINSLK